MQGPLTGLKILDFSALLPGPYASMTLADMGAEVLRIVSPGYPDLAAITPPFLPDGKTTVAIAYLGRGKRCMNLNLKHPEAVDVVHRLLDQYDIVLEQFRPGVMAKLGLDYQSLSAKHPQLIYCSLTGYGQTGCMKDRAGHDINYLSRAGLMSYTGSKLTGPNLVGMQIADVASGSMNAVIGILAAVISRNTTGKGQHVDISMTDGVAAFNALIGAGFLAGDQEPAFENTLLNGGSFYDFYETADGRHISIGSLEPKFFQAFCEAIGRPDCIPGWVMPDNMEQVKAEVREIFKQKTLAEWLEIFEPLDACVEPVMTMGEAYNQPLAADRKWVVETELPDGSTVTQPGVAIKFSGTPPKTGKAGAPGGVDTEEVLAALGYDQAEIKRMAQGGMFD